MHPHVIIFDLDGTLAASKQPLDSEMSGLLTKLLEQHYVCVISGGSFDQFQKQFLSSLDTPKESLARLILLPTSGASLYYHTDTWHKKYEETIAPEDASRILALLDEAHACFEYELNTPYGPSIENRGTQITLSPLGQHAPVALKEPWDPSQEKRRAIVSYLQPLLPEFTITIGGMTSIDITQKGVDKSYGIQKIAEHLNLPISDMLFVGDALYEGGNDYPARKSGITCHQVADVSETKQLITTLLS